MANLSETGEETSEELPIKNTFYKDIFAIKIPIVPYKIVMNTEK